MKRLDHHNMYIFEIRLVGVGNPKNNNIQGFPLKKNELGIFKHISNVFIIYLMTNSDDSVNIFLTFVIQSFF